jgi:diguanylate cyclase
MNSPEKRYSSASYEQTRAVFERAVAFLEEIGLAPNPVNFLVAYEYALGEDDDLLQEIKTHMERHLPWDDSVMGMLFERVLGAHSTDPYDGLSSELMGLLGSLLEQVSDARLSMSDYRQVLADKQNSLSTKPSAEMLRAIVGELMTATQGVAQAAGALQEQLDTTQREAEALRYQLEEIKHEAEHDPLTGAYNRKALGRIMDSLIERTRQEAKPFCLLVADIDHFKNFNDSYGHLLGDEVLKRVTQVMHQQVKGGDFVARYGGEEFMIMLPDTPLQGGMIVAEAIRNAVEHIVLVRRSTKERLSKVTISLGVGGYFDGEDKLSFMERVDAALYRAKREGRNRIMQAELAA